MNQDADNPKSASGTRIALTGATGYVGGRLAPLLLERGYSIRCIARTPRKLDERPWRRHDAVEVVKDELSDPRTLAEQLRGCTAAYYLVHSMIAAGSGYADRDRALAQNFAEAAAAAGVERIIYLGGLGEVGDSLSEHLRSRRETESILASTGVPVTTLRAAMIIGSGSASFEILQYLVNRLPVMVTPRWVETECQPVAISDVLYWLAECLKTPDSAGQVLEVGGPDVLSYKELMQVAAAELGLRRRLILSVPVLTPRLSSAWISLVTPVPYQIARPLADGLSNRVVVEDHPVQEVMPHEALTVREAIRHALSATQAGRVETRWSVAGPVPGDPDWAGGKVFVDERSIDIEADADSVFAAVCRIGGGHGWYAGDLLWRLRGWMDQAVGGPGLRRGRRHPEDIEYGETLDFWRVVGLERGRSLSLHAEMKLPGEAQLDFDIREADSAGKTRLTMTARYRPRGLVGLAYWYAVAPLHNVVFGGMLKGIRDDTAEAIRRGGEAPREARTAASSGASGYGRSRLWLGISAVGTIVVLSSLALAMDAPAALNRHANDSAIGTLASLVTFVFAYILVQLPFDFLGGYLLPRYHGRAHPTLPAFLQGLTRGVAMHAITLLACACLATLAGAALGVVGVVLAATLAAALLLLTRARLALLYSALTLTPSEPNNLQRKDYLRVLLAESADEGFTGGVLGVARPTGHLLPLEWRRVLGAEGFELALKRRSLAIGSGAWGRGRTVAIGFILFGVAVSAWLAGPDQLGTAGGTIAMSLWFTLWSFLGLLVLPTLSRRAVAELDRQLYDAGYLPEALDRTTRLLDARQDDEPERPGLVETIFHPIPSVQNRTRGPMRLGVRGAWDAARLAVFLSASGVGLLGRAVHCNCGRPALWVFLPTD
ncbi:SDR family oxidoreductase [Botrimarina mediterranea]|uniref:SDR family oxidoreductase n=1 Tax=Botrimarina mediterranea TaxID=2528022 RepID=UPI0011889251|nr:NmrA-like family protein [Planctomycetes bacterium K2D]